MRDRPEFVELEPPPARPTRIDGLTNEQWAARRLARERRWRIGCGLLLGLLVGLFAIWHWGFLGERFRIAAGLVVVGSMVLFAALFARRRDAEALDYAAWIAFTEWKLVEKMPWWMIAAIGAALFVVLFLIGTVLVLGRLPAF